jgi:hypothetical protein
LALTDILFNTGESSIFQIPPGSVFTPLYTDGTVYTRPQGTVLTNVSNSATTFNVDRLESTTDFWAGALVLFTTGTLKHQVRKCTAYNGTTAFLTFTTGFTSTPSAGDKFILLNF